MPGINDLFTGSWLDHDQAAYARWVDRQANLRAAEEAAAERRAVDRAERSRRVRGAAPARSAALRHG